MDTFSGQTSIFELVPELAALEQTWMANAQGPVRCRKCHRVVRSDEAAAAALGSHCAAQIGRAVVSGRPLSAAAKRRSATRRNRDALRKARLQAA